LILTPLSEIYGAAASWRRWQYDRQPERRRRLSRPVVSVGNIRVGGSGNLAIEYVARAKPDGYTILLWGGSNIAGMMSVLKNPPVDVAKTLQVTATINPLRSKEPGGLLVEVKLPDGRTLGNGPGRGPAAPAATPAK